MTTSNVIVGKLLKTNPYGQISRDNSDPFQQKNLDKLKTKQQTSNKQRRKQRNV